MINAVELTEQFWLLAFDLKASGQDLEPDQIKWLRHMRYNIWETLRMNLKLVPIQNSLWLIRDTSQLEKVEKLANAWVEKYREKGFSVKMEIFPIATTTEGAQTFSDWEFEFLMEWLGSVQESIEKAKQNRKATKKQITDWVKKIELIQEISASDFTGEKLAELQDMAVIVLDSIEEVKVYAK